MEVIPGRLRAYVRTHAKQMNEWLDGDYRTARRASRPASRLRRQERTADTPPKRAPRRARVSAAERRRIRERADQFLADVAALSVPSWVTVADRFSELVRERSKEYETALEANIDISLGIAKGLMLPAGQTKAAWEAEGVRTRNACKEIAELFSETVRKRGRTVRLRHYAGTALFIALSAIRNFADLEQTAAGKRAIRVLLGPFDGFVRPL